MRKLYYFFIVLVVCFILTQCDSTTEDSSPKNNYLKTWSLSGVVDVYRCFDNDEPNIKMAAFFIAEGIFAEPGDPIVSNVIDLGNSDENTDDVPFTLNIDVSNLSPDTMDEVLIVAWQDNDNDNELDAGEFAHYVGPNVGCPVFGDDISCSFIFFTEEDAEFFDVSSAGWYLVKENFEYVAITTTYQHITGADLNDGGILW